MELGRFKQFPPGRAGVLLPTASRRTAALGICMHTASRPFALRVQWATFRCTRLLGARVLPGPSKAWVPNIDGWEELLSTWRRELGPFDGLAVYQRRQQSRTGLTFLLVNRGKPVAVTKLRDDVDSLHAEQRALDAVQRACVTTFRVPAPLGAATLDNGLAWSAQTAVFDAPHRPAFAAPVALFDEIGDALNSIVDRQPGQSAAHRDLTPWNLRIDRRGQLWLFDWEDVGVAPLHADRCYFFATAHALKGTAIPADLPPAAVDHWSAVVTARRAESKADSSLRDAILSALDIARQTQQEQQIAVDVTP